MRIRLGDAVFPPNFPYALERHRDAEQFYNILTIEFANGDRPPSAQKIVPFFVPINIEVAGRTYKLAFLEGNGERYKGTRIPSSNSSRRSPVFLHLRRARLDRLRGADRRRANAERPEFQERLARGPRPLC